MMLDKIKYINVSAYMMLDKIKYIKVSAYMMLDKSSSKIVLRKSKFKTLRIYRKRKININLL